MRVILIILSIIILASCKKEYTIVSALSCKCVQTPDDDTLDVVVLAGQSNMEGANSNSPFPDSFKTQMDSILIFFKPTNNSINNGSIQKLKYGVNNNWRVNEPARVGSELGMGKYIQNAHKKAGLIKYAYQGSRLVDHQVFTAGHWQVDATHSLKHYSILVNNFVKPGLDSFRAAGYKVKIVALCWCQGEADSQDSICASRYERELGRLDSAFRVDVPEAANMKLVVTRTRLNTWPYAAQVRQAHMSFLDWINSDTWQLNSDLVHYSRSAQCLNHGKDEANIIVPLIH